MNNEIVNGCKAMTYGDMRKIGALNAAHGWGFTLEELKALGKQHKAAREKGNIRRMEKIEYRLEDCNFHTECSLLNDGDYDGYAETCEANWRK